MLHVKNLNLVRSNRSILKSINFELQDGVTAIIGPNGAGKTSLIKCLGGLVKDYDGHINFLERNLLSYAPKEIAKIRAYASQSNEVIFPFSAYDIVNLGRYARGDELSLFENNQIVEEVMTSFDIFNLKDQNFNTLSGGEKQRVQLARVFAQIWELEGGLIFLDEPTSALDFSHQVRLFNLLTQKKESKNWKIVIILHDLQAADMFADNIVLMNKGEIFKSGTTSGVLTEDNLFQVYQTQIKKVTHEDTSLYSIFS